EDLVVDVGDVADERDRVAAAHQPAAQHVVVDAAAQVTDVRLALHGETTQVDTDVTGRLRNEVAHRPGRGVVQAQRHPERVAVPPSGVGVPSGAWRRPRRRWTGGCGCSSSWRTARAG